MAMDYELIVSRINYASLFAFVFFLFFAWFYIFYFIIACIPVKLLPDSDKHAKFAVLIPARNESKVIKGILDCFLKMDYPREFFEVFVIVETSEDPTVQIVEDAGFKVVIRKDLEGKRTKGYALDEAYKSIKESGEHFDAYMVFDADNIVKPDYLRHMNNCYQEGYQVSVGYRNFTNANKNWLCACSAVLFAYINQFTSRGRSLLFKKATLTGTGYYIAGEILDNEGGWIWNGMTEDVQLTTYCYYHNVKMHYYPHAMYYDEQSEKFSITRKQHCRWVWGYFADRKQFKKKENVYETKNKFVRFLSLFEYNVSIIPFIVITVVFLLCFIASFILMIIAAVNLYENIGFVIARTIFQFFILRFVFMFASAFTLGIDNKNLKFGFFRCLSVVLTYILFFGSFVVGFLDGLFHKSARTNWKKIEHTGVVTNNDAIKVENAKKR